LKGREDIAMIEPPQIVQTQSQLVASIRLCVPWSRMQEVMGPGLREVTAAVAAQGIAATGPWFTHHFRRPTDTFDFAICRPVAAAVKPVGRVTPDTLPAATAARTIYHGGYDGLGAAWGEFGRWIADNGHNASAEFWECYVAGPESGPDPSAWRTQLNWPLVAAKV
jgi:effector-binding domain-containing protein